MFGRYKYFFQYFVVRRKSEFVILSRYYNLYISYHIESSHIGFNHFFIHDNFISYCEEYQYEDELYQQSWAILRKVWFFVWHQINAIAEIKQKSFIWSLAIACLKRNKTWSVNESTHTHRVRFCLSK